MKHRYTSAHKRKYAIRSSEAGARRESRFQRAVTGVGNPRSTRCFGESEYFAGRRKAALASPVSFRPAVLFFWVRACSRGTKRLRWNRSNLAPGAAEKDLSCVLGDHNFNASICANHQGEGSKNFAGIAAVALFLLFTCIRIPEGRSTIFL